MRIVFGKRDKKDGENRAYDTIGEIAGTLLSPRHPWLRSHLPCVFIIMKGAYKQELLISIASGGKSELKRGGRIGAGW